jgi:hypothetical protein
MKKADTYTVRELLRIRSGIEQTPLPDEQTEYFWTELLKTCTEADVLRAAWDHYRDHPRTLWPADVLSRALAMARERERRARSLPAVQA